jgi:hypothetical protein
METGRTQNIEDGMTHGNGQYAFENPKHTPHQGTDNEKTKKGFLHG